LIVRAVGMFPQVSSFVFGQEEIVGNSISFDESVIFAVSNYYIIR